MSSALLTSDLVQAAPILLVAGWAMLTLLAEALGQGRSARLRQLDQRPGCLTEPNRSNATQIGDLATEGNPNPVGGLGTLGLLLGLGVTIRSWLAPATAVEIFGGMLLMDRFALFLDAVFLVSGVLTLLLAGAYSKEHRFAYGEHPSLLLLVIVGMMLLVHAGDFVTLVIGLETMSIGVYALTASWSGNRKSAEAGFKYFIMGAVATAFLLYGVALLYGETGTTSLRLLVEAGQRGSTTGKPLYQLGMFLILAALAFKVALVPFHAWVPDVYEGAPTTATGFMAAAVKAAGFGALLRVLLTAFGSDAFVFGSTGWADSLRVIAIFTMIIGNITALRQNNLKRMLAYSSVSHAGYLLLGVIAAGVIPASQGGSSAPVLFYLAAYSVTTLGCFGMVAWLGSWNDERVSLEEWSGLASRHPAAAAAMTVFLLSLGGIPPTAGFFAKFYLFKAALGHSQLTSLVIVAALNSVVSIFYYLRPVVAMYFREEVRQPAPLRSGAVSVALAVALLLTLLLGLLPGPVLDWASVSGMALSVH